MDDENITSIESGMHAEHINTGKAHKYRFLNELSFLKDRMPIYSRHIGLEFGVQASSQLVELSSNKEQAPPPRELLPEG